MKNQSFNDGNVKIYNIENTAEPGDMPNEGLVLKATLRYHERTVGITRHYAAIQNESKVAAVIRCPQIRTIESGYIAILNDGSQYRVDWIQYPEDIEPRVMDLTLVKVGEFYDV